MGELLLSVPVAFILYGFVLPLCGFLIGLIGNYVLPYGFGTLLAIAVAVIIGAEILFAVWVWVSGAAWASGCYYLRHRGDLLHPLAKRMQTA